MEHKEPIPQKIFDKPEEMDELNKLAEEYKDTPKFIRTLRRKIFEEILALAFKAFHEQRESELIDLNLDPSLIEAKPDSMLDFDTNLKKETAELTQVSQLHDYCISHSIPFPDDARMAQMRREVANVFKHLKQADPDFKTE